MCLLLPDIHKGKCELLGQSEKIAIELVSGLKQKRTLPEDSAVKSSYIGDMFKRVYTSTWPGSRLAASERS